MKQETDLSLRAQLIGWAGLFGGRGQNDSRHKDLHNQATRP